MRVYRFTCFYYLPESERLGFGHPCLYTHDKWTLTILQQKRDGKGDARNWEGRGRGGVESVSVLIEYKGLDDQGDGRW